MPSQQERIVFQTSIFRCKLLVSGRVIILEMGILEPPWDRKKKWKLNGDTLPEIERIATIKMAILEAVNTFFDLSCWEFWASMLAYRGQYRSSVYESKMQLISSTAPASFSWLRNHENLSFIQILFLHLSFDTFFSWISAKSWKKYRALDGWISWNKSPI